nr:group II intron maturase-specific domain-containing protein [Bacillus cereus]
MKNAGTKPTQDVIKRINTGLIGWVNYFRVGNSSKAFSNVRDYTEMKVRTLLTRRKQ